MNERNLCGALVLSLIGAGALLSACSEHASRSMQEASGASAANSDLPEIVVTAHAWAEPRDDSSNQRAQSSISDQESPPADFGRAAEAKVRAPTDADDETG